MKTWFWGLHRQLFKKSITLLEQLKRHWIRIDVGRRFPGVSSSICTKDGRENDKGGRVKRPKPAESPGPAPPGTSPAVHGTHMKQLRIPEVQMIQWPYRGGNRRVFRQRSSLVERRKWRRWIIWTFWNWKTPCCRSRSMWYGEIYAPGRTGILHGKK